VRLTKKRKQEMKELRGSNFIKVRVNNLMSAPLKLETFIDEEMIDLHQIMRKFDSNMQEE
jgi:hypothetical protein